nr:hypothetical protein [Tanacetum cinerariifolium]
MDTTIDQQVVMDEALVPHAQRLRIGRSNFCLLSNIKSKESTLQLVYDVLRMCPFFKAFLGLYSKRNVDYAYLMWEDFVYQVKHKNSKKSNEMYYPRFMKVIIHHFMSKDPSILRRNKASVQKTRSSSDTSIPPLTTAAGLRLTTSTKGKQAAKASKAKSLSSLFENMMKKQGMRKVLILSPKPMKTVMMKAMVKRILV